MNELVVGSDLPYYTALDIKALDRNAPQMTKQDERAYRVALDIVHDKTITHGRDLINLTLMELLEGHEERSKKSHVNPAKVRKFLGKLQNDVIYGD